MRNQFFGKWKKNAWKDAWIGGVLVLSLLAVSPLEAFGRGGGGAGRAGGGGAGRGGGAAAARPAVSRPASAPARSVSSSRPAVNRSAVSRPSPVTRPNPGINRTPSMSRVNIPSRSNIPARQNISPQINQLQRQRQGQIGTGRTPSHITQVGNQLGNQLDNQAGIQRVQSILQQPTARTRPNDWRQQWGALHNQGDQLRDRVRQDPRGYMQRGLRQGYQWWDANRRPVGADWRRPANWGALNTWLGWGAAAPLYYNYTDGLYYYAPDTTDQGYTYPTTYDNTYSYGDTYSTYPASPSPYYTSQDLTSQQGNWLPLGFFVVTSGAASNASPKWYLELAVDSQGNLEGYVYNAALDITSEVVGVIDPTTQEARWQFKNQIDSPLFSTGAYNLTQGETAAQMIYPDGRTVQLFMARIDRNG